MWLSQRVQQVQPSPTLAVDAKAKELKAAGMNVVSFGAGEPDFDTPVHIKEAAKRAIDAGFTKYCPVTGTPDLKQAIIEQLQLYHNVSYRPEEVIVSCGAKHALYNLFQAVLDEKDEIIVPAPYWVSYPDMAALAGAKARFVKTKDSRGFKLQPKQLKRAIRKKTKAIVINSPSNPTGAVYTEQELREIAEICLEKNLLIVSDEIYGRLVYDRMEFVSMAQLGPEVRAQTVIVNGVSKAYAMTGWRIGYAAGPAEIIGAMGKIQSQSTSNPASISMKAAAEAIRGTQGSVETMRREFEKRRNYIVDRLNAMEDVRCFRPQGAFYVFPNFKKLLGRKFGKKTVRTTAALADYLLETAQVATVPGEAFGAPGYLRLSYAISMKSIKEGLDRIEKALKAK